MSINRNMRRLNKKAQEKGKELPIPNYHIAHKKARKYGTGVKYHQKAGDLTQLSIELKQALLHDEHMRMGLKDGKEI